MLNDLLCDVSSKYRDSILRPEKYLLSCSCARHEGLWAVEVYLHLFLTLELDTSDWAASSHDRFAAEESAPDMH